MTEPVRGEAAKSALLLKW